MAFKYNQCFCFFITQFTCKLKNKENTAIIHNTNLQFQSECFGYSLELQNAISGTLYSISSGKDKKKIFLEHTQH